MMIRAKDAVHVGLFASTGAGKGVSFLIPNMLSLPGGVVALDPQGSIFEATAAHRARAFKQRVIRLDSSGICGPGGDSLNPLDFIDADAPDCLDQCADLASLIVLKTGLEHDPHWNASAEQVLKVFIYYIVRAETDLEKRNLLAVRAIVASRDAYHASLNIMRQSDDLLASQADTLSWLTDKELNSVLSTVQRHTAWMDSPTVAAGLSRSSFDPLDLRRGRMTVFIIQSPDRLITMASHLRILIGTLLRVLTRGKASEKNPVWFLIDETAALGRMQVLENAITTTRGYGIRLFLVYQSPGQLQKIYGENASTVLDNLGTQIMFALRSPESGEHISKAIGDYTADIQTGSWQEGQSRPTGGTGQPTPGNASHSSSRNDSQIARRWLKPEEIRTLNPDVALVFHKHLHVIPVKRVLYFSSPRFKSRLTGRPRSGEDRGLGIAGFAAACFFLATALIFSEYVGRFLALDAERREDESIPSRRETRPNRQEPLIDYYRIP